MQPNSTISPPQGRCLLRLPAVSARTGMGKTAIYSAIKAGKFPAPVRLGYRTSAWDSVAIDQWIERQLGTEEAA